MLSDEVLTRLRVPAPMAGCRGAWNLYVGEGRHRRWRFYANNVDPLIHAGVYQRLRRQ